MGGQNKTMTYFPRQRLNRSRVHLQISLRISFRITEKIEFDFFPKNSCEKNRECIDYLFFFNSVTRIRHLKKKESLTFAALNSLLFSVISIPWFVSPRHCFVNGARESVNYIASYHNFNILVRPPLFYGCVASYVETTNRIQTQIVNCCAPNYYCDSPFPVTEQYSETMVSPIKFPWPQPPRVPLHINPSSQSSVVYPWNLLPLYVMTHVHIHCEQTNYQAFYSQLIWHSVYKPQRTTNVDNFFGHCLNDPSNTKFFANFIARWITRKTHRNRCTWRNATGAIWKCNLPTIFDILLEMKMKNFQ